MTAESGKCPNGRTGCKGHKRYRGGGTMDGHVTCLTIAHPSDYPEQIGTMLRNGSRSWYVRETDPTEGSDVAYRFVGLGRECPQS